MVTQALRGEETISIETTSVGTEGTLIRVRTKIWAVCFKWVEEAASG